MLSLAQLKIAIYLVFSPSACDQALDIGVVIDSSDSITLEDYNLCLKFVADLAKRFKDMSPKTSSVDM